MGSMLTRIDSVYLSRDVCPGHKCENEEHPILDLDERGQCSCRQHPCWNQDGLKHECSNPEFPLLSYREDQSGKGICECKARMIGGGDNAAVQEFSNMQKYDVGED